MNVATEPVVATLGPASIVPVPSLVGDGPWPLSVDPSELVKIVVSEPRESVVVSLGHPMKKGTVTFTFPQTWLLKSAAASNRSADNQTCFPRDSHTCLVCLIAIPRETTREGVDIATTAT